MEERGGEGLRMEGRVGEWKRSAVQLSESYISWHYGCVGIMVNELDYDYLFPTDLKSNGIP